MDHDSTLSITAIPVGTTINDNISIDSVRIKHQPIVEETSFELQIELANHGNILRSKLPITIRDGGETIDSFELDLPASGIVKTSRILSLKHSGDHLLTIQSSPAGIPLDDSRQIIASVIASIHPVTIKTSSWQLPDLKTQKVVILEDISQLDE